MNDVPWLLWLVRAIAFAAGCLSLYGAALLYESEDGQLENRMEHLKDLTAVGGKPLGAHRSFAVRVAEHSSAVMDRVYGQRLVSIEAAATCVFLCAVLGYLLVNLPFYPAVDRLIDAIDRGAGFLRAVIVLCAWSTVLLTLLISLLAYTTLRRLGGPGGLIFAAAGVAAFFYYPESRVPIAVVSAVFVANLFVVATVRWLIRFTASGPQAIAFVMPLTVSIGLVGVALVLTPLTLLLWRDSVDGLGWALILRLVIALSVVFATVSAAPLLLMAVVLLALLTHRLVWPAVLRPLYSFRHRRILFAHRKAGLGLGIYLMLAGLVPETVIPRTILEALLSQFGFDVGN
jgi:hypothetical protein